ncbi:MAG: ABC transporter permease [Spirochaeta sp.]|nr:ABC transporter permease [Spirochaeta sp.]
MLAGPSHLLLAVPEFWLGILLLLAFSVHFGAFPLFGYEGWRSLVLPTAALALGRGAVLARYIRSSLSVELQREYVTAARVRGLSPTRVVLLHAAPNALLPVITIAAIQLGYLIGGVVIIENVFSLPGIGRLLLSAIFRRDYPVIQAAVMLSAFAFSLANFVADLLYGLADPRLRG